MMVVFELGQGKSRREEDGSGGDVTGGKMGEG